MVLRKRSKKLLIIAMVVVTAVWIVALYLHVQAYNRAKQDDIEEYLARGFDEDFVHGVLDFLPLWGFGFGGYLVISAIIIFWAWLIILAITMDTDSSQTKQ